MKKQKKLALSKETVATFRAASLPWVAGGDTFSFDSLCPSLCVLVGCRPPIVVGPDE